MENGRTSHQKLLVARSNEKSEEVYRRVQLLPKKQKLHRTASRQANAQLSQMATYWFVIAWFDNQSVQKSEVKQVAKDVVKSEVYPQTYSP